MLSANDDGQQADLVEVGTGLAVERSVATTPHRTFQRAWKLVRNLIDECLDRLGHTDLGTARIREWLGKVEELAITLLTLHFLEGGYLVFEISGLSIRVKPLYDCGATMEEDLSLPLLDLVEDQASGDRSPYAALRFFVCQPPGQRIQSMLEPLNREPSAQVSIEILGSETAEEETPEGEASDNHKEE